MAFFILPNLSAVGVREGVPWEIPVRIPDGVRGKPGDRAATKEAKKARTVWATSPETDTVIYAAVEGRNSRARVTKARGEDDGNPPHAIHALVVDYDIAVTDDELTAGMQRMTYRPTVIERTLSGNARAIWTFAEPVRVPGYDAASGFLVHLSTILQVQALAPGIDEGALKAPDRYYTWSGDFFLTGAEPLPTPLVRGWWVEFAGKLKLSGSEFSGTEIPFEVLREMLSAKYPRFSEWPVEFAADTQGPSFWVEGSTSPLSAIAKPQGMLTWAAHATKAFYSWEDLLGAPAAEYRTRRLGEAVEGLHYDGKNYWRQLPDGRWKAWEKTDILGHLKATRGISARPDKTGTSDLDRCIQHIHDHQQVDGAAPFAMLPSGAITVFGHRVLNTSTRRVLTPSESPEVWGADGRFPFLSRLLDVLFDDGAGDKQLPHFLGWLQYAYRAAHAQRPTSGPNLILAGGAGTGKTLLSRRVIGPLFGGYSEASDYLMGIDSFGAELFDSGVWCVDDAVVSADRGTHRRFSELLKKMAANTTFRYHAKFRQATLVDWRGRVVVTCNRDVLSLRIIPDLTISIADKLSLLRCVQTHEHTGFVFPGTVETEDILDRELPYFARWLLDMTPAPNLVRDPRFGWRPYLHPDLVNEAHQSSWGATFGEILAYWSRLYFSVNSTATEWRGSAFGLYCSLQADPAISAAMRTSSPEQMSRNLSALLATGDPRLSCSDVAGQREWVIRKV